MSNHFITILIGSLLGFSFAFTLYCIKEYFNKKARTETARLTLVFMLRELAKTLEREPRIYTHISAENLNEHRPYILRNNLMHKCYQGFHLYYGQWVERAYIRTRRKSAGRDKEILLGYIEELEKLGKTTLRIIREDWHGDKKVLHGYIEELKKLRERMLCNIRKNWYRIFDQ